MEIREGRYRLIRRIGAGGTGVVYQSADTLLGRPVAIKELDPAYSAGMMRREGRSLAQVKHPNVVEVHDLFEERGRAYLVMEYVEGGNLERRLAASDGCPPLGMEEALAVFRQVAAAVAAAHRCGVLHCDLKPANVLISTAGEVKLTDFTLAQVATGGRFDGVRGGTAAYAAPEQMNGGRIDERTDVYGLGALLARLVVGVDRSSEEAQRVFAAIERATAADPDNRFASVGELLAALPPIGDSVTEVTGAGSISDLTRILSGSRTDIEAGGQSRRPVRRVLWSLALLPVAAIVATIALFTHFTANASPTTVTVPEVVAVPQSSAQLVVHSLGLRSRVQLVYSASVPSGIVIAQQPAAENRVVKGTRLTLVVSEGPRPVAVPALQGLSQSDAIARLRQLGFRVQVSTMDDILDSPGQVRGQTPDPGTVRLPGTVVSITVSVKPWWWVF